MRSLPRGTTASRAVVGWSALTATGLVVAAVGTFLPWLRSGLVNRDSYEAAAVVERLFSLGSLAHLALRAWNGVVVATALCLVLLVLGLWRTAATLASVIGVTVGTVSALLTVQGVDVAGLVRVAFTGPATSTVGSLVALSGGLGLFLAAHRTTTTHARDG